MVKPKLTILVCSTHTRSQTFLPKIFEQINPQLESNPEVEVLSLIDNKRMTVGKKRNVLLSLASGDYVIFVDDDDIISPDYVSCLLSAIESGNDVICFHALYKPNNKPVHFSRNYQDSELPDRYLRVPNHLMCFKRELATQVPFPDISYREDFDWAKRVLPLIKTETLIDKILYVYDFNVHTSETLKRR